MYSVSGRHYDRVDMENVEVHVLVARIFFIHFTPVTLRAKKQNNLIILFSFIKRGLWHDNHTFVISPKQFHTTDTCIRHTAKYGSHFAVRVGVDQ